MFTLYGMSTRRMLRGVTLTEPSPFVNAKSLSSFRHYTTDHNISMPVLQSVAERGRNLVDFKKTAFFGIQHILRTNVPLFQHLIQTLGANPQYIFLNGKGYSDSEEAEGLFKELGIHYFKLDEDYVIPGRYQNRLRTHLKKSWEVFTQTIKTQLIEKIVVFDEGGHCFETMPEPLCFKYAMAGIEQTRGGLYSPTIEVLPFPLVEVASSAAKRQLESPLIIEALLKKLQAILSQKTKELNSDTVFGVLGNGAIGYHLTRYLLRKGYNVVAFDENPSSFSGPEWKQKNFYRGKNVREVLIRSSTIFGCTGKNVIKTKEILDSIATDKTLVSCTSEDKEFQSILQEMSRPRHSSLFRKLLTGEKEELCYITRSGGNITILNKGFPINFDHSGESVPAEEIQLTRALMLGAFIQAARQAELIKGEGKINKPPRLMLDPTLQQYITHQFKLHQLNNTKLSEKWPLFEDLKSIEDKSDGQKGFDLEITKSFSNLVEKSPMEKNKSLKL